MTPEPHRKLAHMAEQIAEFFASYPVEKSAQGVADHINQFWSKKMRLDFCAHFDADPDGLSPLLRRALPLIRRAKAA